MDAKGKGAFEISEDKALQRDRPKGLARLRTYATGKEILVLGPSSAGKSKFAEYLQLGRLHPEGEREMTYGVTKSPTFVLTLATDPDASRSGRSGLVLNVRRTVDTPGQTGPVQHASLVGDRKPHAIVIMLDGSKPISATIHWLSLFCNRLDTVLRKSRHVQKKLREIAVVLNKRDKIDQDQCNELAAGVREVLQRHLSVVLGVDRVGTIPIFECISIQTPQGTALIDTVLTHLAQQLTG
ncbi:MAG TPA: GTPase domain-containing protein [Sedimentisphaerales bacterium]|nr:GTPase domain-containing protein [Sedimentisphaerales bacterium]HRS12611.1 GTPase domain-containing protein [Sedimentisphaerales bacterium]HRV49249.1 GTPase domain-containing protein [Sedimentisphaerales bacterium]